MKTLADNKLNFAEKLIFVLGMIENIVGKGQNADYQHFLLFPKYFQKASILGLLVMVIFGFNATLTAAVISWQSVRLMCFLAFSHKY